MPDISSSRSSNSEIACACPLQTLYEAPAFPFSMMIRYALTVSRTSMKSRLASRLPTMMTGSRRFASISAIWCANDDTTKSGACPGPV